jgi:hypothetical protein
MKNRNFATGAATLHSVIILQLGGLAGGCWRGCDIIARYVKVALGVFPAGGRTGILAQSRCVRLGAADFLFVDWKQLIAGRMKAIPLKTGQVVLFAGGEQKV